MPYSAIELRLPERRTTVPIADACDEGAARGAAPQRCKRRSAAIGVYGGLLWSDGHGQMGHSNSRLDTGRKNEYVFPDKAMHTSG